MTPATERSETMTLEHAKPKALWHLHYSLMTKTIKSCTKQWIKIGYHNSKAAQQSKVNNYFHDLWTVFLMQIYVYIPVTRWRFGWDDSFQPEGRGFDSRSSRHVGTLGKSLTHSCLWRETPAQYPCCVGSASEYKWTWRGAIEMVWMNEQNVM